MSQEQEYAEDPRPRLPESFLDAWAAVFIDIAERAEAGAEEQDNEQTGKAA